MTDILRANTYTPVATGTCPGCRRDGRPLRFVYNPHGHDIILCTTCGDEVDDMGLEAADTCGAPRGRSVAEVAGDVETALGEAYTGWPAHVRQRFDRVMARAREDDKKRKAADDAAKN